MPALTRPDQVLGAGPAAAPGASTASAWRDPVSWLIAGCVFGAYLVISLFRLLRFDPASWDLAIYTEYVARLSRGQSPVVNVRGAGFNLLGDHFQVIVGLLAPFFRVFPSPATLLVAQALLTAVSVFPVTSLASSLLGRPAGRLVGFAYGASWGLQQMIDFDFHEIAFAVPLLAFSLAEVVRRRPLRALAWALPLVFVKEDQGFTVAAIGVFLAVRALRDIWGRRDRAGTGWQAALRRGATADDLWSGVCLVCWGLFWSFLAIKVIIPHFAVDHRYYYWRDGGIFRPGAHFSLRGLADQTANGYAEKLQTVAMLALPTAFLAFGSPLGLLALPSLALRFMSPNTAYWGTFWHYNATLMPVLFIAAIDVLSRWRGLPAGPPGRFAALRTGMARHGAPMMAAIAVALAFQYPLSDLWQGSTYRVTAHDDAAAAAVAMVPDGVTAQATLGLLAPLAARTDAYWIGNGGNPVTQYVLIDGVDSGYTPAPKNIPAFVAQLYPGDGYVQVFARDGVYVFRRG